MPLYILEKTNDPSTLINGVNKMLVSAEDAVDARALALGYSDIYPRGYWADATLSSAIVLKPDYEGVKMRIRVYSPAGALVADATSAVGVSTDDVDDLVAKMVTALNATSAIGGAAYSTPNLTVASGGGGDDLGDHRIVATIIPATGEGGDNTTGDETLRSVSSIFDATTDEGAAADALAIAFDTAIQAPQIHAVFGDQEN